MSLSKPSSADNAVNLPQRWTRHLREASKSTLNLACPACKDRPVQTSEQELLQHFSQEHPQLVPPQDGEEYGKWRMQIVAQAQAGQPRPRAAHLSKVQAEFQHQADKSALTLAAVANPTPVTATLLTELEKHKIDEGRQGGPYVDDVQEQPSKRMAIGQGKSPSSSVSVHTSHSQESPRRSKAQVARKAPAPQPMPRPGDSHARPATANKRLFDPTGDSSMTQPHKAASNVPPRLNQPRHRKSDPPLNRSIATPTLLQKPTSGLAPGTLPASILTANMPTASTSSPSVPQTLMASQPETKPISQDQLVAEVKGIYTGLVMVEGKCIQVDLKQAQLAREAPPNTRLKLGNEQWQALIALHRTLLHEHHDFFLASQHPSTTPGVRRLALKYAMPARLWKHGIHSFLELLRSRLPESLEHMLAFIYLAFNILTLLYETIPAFEDTWIECLGDLGRYRMAIEDNNLRDIEVWTQVSRRWYLLAANRSTGTGRLYHHLAILARPDALPQIMYYGKALAVAVPFTAAKDSIMTLFDPALSGRSTRRRDSPVIKAFIRIQAILFSKSQLDGFDDALGEYIRLLDPHIARITETFRTQGYYTAIAICIALQSYKPTGSCLTAEMTSGTDTIMADASPEDALEAEAFEHAHQLAKQTLRVVLARVGDPNILSMVHVMMVFTVFLARHPTAFAHFARDFPQEALVDMLNGIFRIYERQYNAADRPKMYELISRDAFPWPEKGEPDENNGPVPEDWSMRGLMFTEGYWPPEWFSTKIEAESHYIEKASVTEERRPQRILWLGCRLAKSGWINYNEETHAFSIPGRSMEASPMTETNSSTGSATVVGDEDVFRPPAAARPRNQTWGIIKQLHLSDKVDRTSTWNTNDTESSVWTTNTDNTAATALDHEPDRMDTGGCTPPSTCPEPGPTLEAG